MKTEISSSHSETARDSPETPLVWGFLGQLSGMHARSPTGLAMSNLAPLLGLLSVGSSNCQVPSNHGKQPPNMQLPKLGLPGSRGDRNIA